jgi:glucan-binding YG repeat protein
MSMITVSIDTSYTANTAVSLLSSTLHTNSPASSNSSKTSESSSPDAADNLTLSAASHTALAASQTSATDPFAGKTTAELQAIHSEVMQEILQSSSPKQMAQDALQLPVPATQERLASAKMATERVSSGGQTQNPFAGLSRSELTAIIYDQSGKYTINERVCALGQQEDNDTAFLTAASNQSLATGNRSFIYTALQELSQQQLPVEKAVPTESGSAVTTPEELSQMVDTYGDSATLAFNYPDGWTPASSSSN